MTIVRSHLKEHRGTYPSLREVDPRSSARHTCDRRVHPDPSIIRIDRDYYLVTSSFEYSPGVPLFHSTDLVDWTQLGNALDRSTQFEADSAEASGGIYAPTLRFHEEKYFLVTTHVGATGHLLVFEDDPRGRWSDPVRIDAAIGIGPDLVWDEQGAG